MQLSRQVTDFDLSDSGAFFSVWSTIAWKMKRVHAIASAHQKNSCASVEDFALPTTTKFSQYIAHGTSNAFQLFAEI